MAVRNAARPASAGDIVMEVERLLGSSVDGKASVERFNHVVEEVVASLASLGEMRKRLRQRSDVQFYVNVSSAHRAQLRSRVELSVRVRGIECGTVAIGASAERQFRPTNPQHFGDCGADDARSQDWGHRHVAGYIKATADKEANGRPEADVEAAFIRGLKDGEWGQGEQPVCLEGLPFQVPLPIGASGSKVELGNGHIDVVTRFGRGGRGIRIYELKAPKADVSGALDQAVAYVAALRFMLKQVDSSRSLHWWRLIGFTGIPKLSPSFEAVALVADSDKNRKIVGDAQGRLGDAGGIGTRARYYHWDVQRRLELAKA